VAHAILVKKAVGGVTITASHNPYPYNGFKWAPFWAGPAVPAITEDLERRTAAVSASGPAVARFDEAVSDGRIRIEDFLPTYRRKLASLLDRDILRRARLKVGVDCLHGTARSVLRPLLEELGCEVTALHEDRDVLFGGRAPEPSEENLEELQELLRKKRLDLALACDCDADRFGILDPEAGFLQPNEFLGLALHHLVENRGLKGKVARSLMTSHFVDAVAKSCNLEVRETPVGFKYIGDLLRTGEYLIGGEESGGLSIQGHVPEKDGILACLIAAELRACERRPLGKVLKDLFKKVGTFCNQRVNLRLDRPDRFLLVAQTLSVRPPLKLAGSSVWRIDQTDGFKFMMKDGSWLGLRPSGTEPVVRVYAEGSDPKKLAKLLEDGKKILQGKF
jgi:alpha-D-glucose phosphate-specific phosphoglucomutase